MEDTLRDRELEMVVANGGSLNPCFNGRYSQRLRRGLKVSFYVKS